MKDVLIEELYYWLIEKSATVSKKARSKRTRAGMKRAYRNRGLAYQQVIAYLVKREPLLEKP